MNKVQQIIHKYKGQQTWEEMTDYINRTPHLQSELSRATVNMWGLGKSQPGYYLLVHLEREGDGWVSRMAAELLKEYELA